MATRTTADKRGLRGSGQGGVFSGMVEGALFHRVALRVGADDVALFEHENAPFSLPFGKAFRPSNAHSR